METVFKNCDLLLGLNRTLLSDLKMAGPLGDVGQVFNRFAPFLKMCVCARVPACACVCACVCAYVRSCV